MFKFLLFLSSIVGIIIFTNGQYIGIQGPEVESWLKSLNFNSEKNPFIPINSEMIDSVSKKNEKSDDESLPSDVIVAFEPDVDIYTMDNNPTKNGNDEYTIKIEDSTNTASFEKSTTIIRKNTTKKINTFYHPIDNDENNNKNIQINSNGDNEDKNSTDDQLKSGNETVYTEKETNLLSQYPSKVFLHYINRVNGIIQYDICGGVLIKKTQILTSSFCFDRYTPENKKEFTLEKKYTENYKVSLFADALTFSEWEFRLQNVNKIIINKTSELAVLEIPEINISSIINYGFLQESEVSIGENVTVLQNIHFLDRNIDDKLKEGIFSIVDSNNYSQLFDDEDNNNNNYYGRYESFETGYCNILRGDPVYQGKNIVGIMQYVHDCRDFESILLFTKIFKHKNWIENVNIKPQGEMVYYYTWDNKKISIPFFPQLGKK